MTQALRWSRVGVATPTYKMVRNVERVEHKWYLCDSRWLFFDSFEGHHLISLKLVRELPKPLGDWANTTTS